MGWLFPGTCAVNVPIADGIDGNRAGVIQEGLRGPGEARGEKLWVELEDGEVVSGDRIQNEVGAAFPEVSGIEVGAKLDFILGQLDSVGR